MKTTEETIAYLERRIEELKKWIQKNKDEMHYTMIDYAYGRIAELRHAIEYIKYGI